MKEAARVCGERGNSRAYWVFNGVFLDNETLRFEACPFQENRHAPILNPLLQRYKGEFLDPAPNKPTRSVRRAGGFVLTAMWWKCWGASVTPKQ